MVLPDRDDQTDHRQWTQQHLDAADLRVSAMAPTPPQGEADTDCMDVNVRGPGRCTASHPHRPPEALRIGSPSPSSLPGVGILEAEHGGWEKLCPSLEQVGLPRRLCS